MQDDFSSGRDKPRKAPARDAGNAAKVTIRATQGGEVAVAGLSRFPVTLRKGQWLRLLAMSDDIHTFIASHEGDLLP